MNDDELIERLRRTLAERAAALEPAPGRVPDADVGQDPVVEAIETPPGEPRRSWWVDGDPYLADPTGGQPIVSRTGPVPITGRRSRRTPAIAAVVTLVAAAAAVVVGIDVSGGTHHGVTLDNPAGRGHLPAPAVTPGPGPQPVHTPTPAPTTPAPAPTAPTVTTPTTGTDPVPAGFRAYSATFVSAYDGWALGTAPCGPPGSSGTPGNPPEAYCPELAATTDAGYHWHLDGVPAVAEPPTGWGDQPFQVRFADRLDGWIWTTATGAGVSGSQLWSTHDGGVTWREVPDPAGPLHTIADLEASAGRVHMVVIVDTPPYPADAGRSSPYEAIYSSPTGEDRWQAAALQPDLGAGPDPTAQLVLWGAVGWLSTDNRTAVSGARLGPAGWTAAPPACAQAEGSGSLAAASATDLVAECAEGQFGPPQPGTTAAPWLLRSSDGGRTWTPVAAVPGQVVRSVTVAPGQPTTVVVTDRDGLLRSSDGGRTWTRVYAVDRAAAGFNSAPTFVGFTTAAQAVAIAPDTTGGLIMSHDGGADWTPVAFTAG